MQPTAGPWEIDDDEQRIDGIGTVKMYRVVAPDGRTVAEFSNATCNEIVYEDDGEGGGSHWDQQAMANAYVIAAAPDMRKALKDAVAVFGGIVGSSAGEDVMARAKAALAKADRCESIIPLAKG